MGETYTYKLSLGGTLEVGDEAIVHHRPLGMSAVIPLKSVASVDVGFLGGITVRTNDGRKHDWAFRGGKREGQAVAWVIQQRMRNG